MNAFRPIRWFLVGGALAALLVACNTTPIANLERSFTMQVRQSSGTGEKVKIDFLWVVDNSTSMCEEQFALTDNFSVFTDTLAQLNIDPRVAVTTADVQCDQSNPEINSAQGGFNTQPASGFPPSCYAKQIHGCLNDADCNALGDADKWSCKPHLPAGVSCLTNPNGTVNTFCVRRCLTDEECQQKFANSNYICSKPSGNQDDWGCLLPPQTSTCPNEVPAVLDGSNLDLFRCAATVGVNQLKCFQYEQGLRAALDAIDPRGPNPEQAKAFLRDDAYLVILFVSDEDDCSVPPGVNKPISEDFYDTCATLGDTDTGGPLTPVGHFINNFKSLKADPSRVIVAAIAGDSTAADVAQQVVDRDAYVVSKSDKKECFHQSYICNSEVGKADWGSRYQLLTAGFGINGVFTNICDPSGIGPALEQIAKTIIRVVNKMCLPRPVEEGATVRVVKVVDGQEIVLVEGDDGDYKLVPGGDDCFSDVYGDLQAVSFAEPPESNEEIVISYEAKPPF